MRLTPRQLQTTAPHSWSQWMGVCVTLHPLKHLQIVTVPGKVDACAILLQPSFGDPRGLDRLDRSGIPEGSIDSIDRGSLRGDPLGLGRLDRSGIP